MVRFDEYTSARSLQPVVSLDDIDCVAALEFYLTEISQPSCCRRLDDLGETTFIYNPYLYIASEALKLLIQHLKRADYYQALTALLPRISLVLNELSSPSHLSEIILDILKEMVENGLFTSYLDSPSSNVILQGKMTLPISSYYMTSENMTTSADIIEAFSQTDREITAEEILEKKTSMITKLFSSLIRWFVTLTPKP